MTYQSKSVTVTLPTRLTKAAGVLSQKADLTLSELVGLALRDYLLDVQEDRARFLEAYKKTRREKTISMGDLRKKYGLV